MCSINQFQCGFYVTISKTLLCWKQYRQFYPIKNLRYLSSLTLYHFDLFNVHKNLMKFLLRLTYETMSIRKPRYKEMWLIDDRRDKTLDGTKSYFEETINWDLGI